jgi:hypothetical protein
MPKDGVILKKAELLMMSNPAIQYLPLSPPERAVN